MLFIDESGAKTNMTRLYGRAPRGRRVYDHAPFGRWDTTTLIAAVGRNGPQAPWVLKGPMDGDAFPVWARRVLAPTLEPGDIVVMDNLSVHKNAGARETVRVDARPLFNPSGGYAFYVVPAVLVLVMRQTLLIGVAVMGGARREGLVASAANASPLAVPAGRAFAHVTWYSFYPLFHLAVVCRACGFPPPGDPFAAMVFLAPFLVAAAMPGITLAGLFRTPDDAIPALLFMSVPAVFLMGFAWPLETLPVGLRWVAMLLPATPGALGFVRVNQLGASLTEVSGLWFLLWGQALLYAVPAWFAVRGEIARAAAPPEQEARNGAPSAPPQTHETPGTSKSQI